MTPNNPHYPEQVSPNADYERVIRESLPNDPRDLLTPEERERLNADLQEIARVRRWAEAESASIPLAHNGRLEP